MQYGRAVAVVRYMTRVLSDLLSETYTETYADDVTAFESEERTNGEGEHNG
jgi:hypothetical protein